MPKFATLDYDELARYIFGALPPPSTLSHLPSFSQQATVIMSGYSPYGSFHTQSFTTPPTPVAAPGAAAGVGSSSATVTLLADSAVEKIRRHPHYYLNGGDVHFLVSVFVSIEVDARDDLAMGAT